MGDNRVIPFWMNRGAWEGEFMNSLTVPEGFEHRGLFDCLASLFGSLKVSRHEENLGAGFFGPIYQVGAPENVGILTMGRGERAVFGPASPPSPSLDSALLSLVRSLYLMPGAVVASIKGQALCFGPATDAYIDLLHKGKLNPFSQRLDH